MRISDWSSDVCSSDRRDGRAEPVVLQRPDAGAPDARPRPRRGEPDAAAEALLHAPRHGSGRRPAAPGEGRGALDLADRKSVLKGKNVPGRVVFGGRPNI